MPSLKKLMSRLALTCSALAILTAASPAAELTTVRVGITPYFDYMPWVIAKELGLDKELGLNLDLKTISTTAQGVAAMRQGSLDVVSSCHVCDFPLYKSVPSLRSWLISDQFKGFIVIGRKGTDTFKDAAAKVGPEKAKEQILKGFAGKTFSLVPSNFDPLLSAALAQADLKLSDVKVTEFGDDAQAALAFQRGAGDYYMGSLPQETKLLSTPDKYVNVGGQEILGAAGLWYSTMDSTAEWLDKNPETVLKLDAIWYRVSRYADERFDQVAPLWVKATNERAAASFTVDEFKTTFQLLSFPTLQQSMETVFDPASDLYWKHSVEFYAGKKENVDQLAPGFKPDQNALEETYFDRLKTDKDLVNWISSPLK